MYPFVYIRLYVYMRGVLEEKKEQFLQLLWALARANAGTRFFEVKATVRVMHTRLLSLYTNIYI